MDSLGFPYGFGRSHVGLCPLLDTNASALLPRASVIASAKWAGDWQGRWAGDWGGGEVGWGLERWEWLELAGEVGRWAWQGRWGSGDWGF